MPKADFNITSIIVTDGEEERVEFFTVGNYSVTKKGFVLRYAESEGIGYENCSVKITANGKQIAIERTGAAAATLTVEESIKHHCVYGTPFGDFTMGINTYEIDNTLSKEGGRLWFKYSIDINNDFVSENEMEIVVTIPVPDEEWKVVMNEDDLLDDEDGPF